MWPVADAAATRWQPPLSFFVTTPWADRPSLRPLAPQRSLITRVFEKARTCNPGKPDPSALAQALKDMLDDWAIGLLSMGATARIQDKMTATNGPNGQRDRGDRARNYGKENRR